MANELKTKSIGPDDIVNHLGKQPLDVKLSIYSLLKKMIEEHRNKLQQDLELINANVK